MKKLLLLSLLILPVFIAGCATQSEVNDKLIIENKKCLDAGMKPESLGDFGGDVTQIQCVPNN